MTNLHVLIKIDNTTAVNYINKQGGRKEASNKIAREIWEWCIPKGLFLTATYIPGAKNVEADTQSRTYHDNSERSLDDQVFARCGIVGNADIDLFASRANHKTSVSVPGSQTLTHRSWTRLRSLGNGYCVMPSHLPACWAGFYRKSSPIRRLA